MLFNLPLLLTSAGLVAAEDGLAAWLRYAPLRDRQMPHATSSDIVALNSSSSGPVITAARELEYGIEAIPGHGCELHHSGGRGGHERHAKQQHSSSIVAGTVESYTEAFGSLNGAPVLAADGFWLDTSEDPIQILGQNERGALYGAFEYLSMLARGDFSKVAYGSSPSAPIRWINQWDNMDGRIERGYGGASLWFSNMTIKHDLSRAGQYARLCASIGLNAIVINNVNANESILTDESIAGQGIIVDQFRTYGVQLGMSINFASPNLTEPNIGTFDLLLPIVQDWWSNKTAKIYDAVPDFAGYLLKANSEGQPGTAEYNRTLSDGANMIATAIEPFGGILMFRSFLYDYENLDRDR